MTLSSTLNTLVGRTFSLIGDLAQRGTYYHPGTLVYDPDTDTQTETGAITLTNVRMVPTEITKVLQLDNVPMKPGDQVVLIPNVDLTFEPAENDTLTLNGWTWNVQRVMTVPGQSLWKLLVRRN